MKKLKSLLIATVGLLLIAALTAGCAFTGGVADPVPTDPVSTAPTPAGSEPAQASPTSLEVTDPTETTAPPETVASVFLPDTPQSALMGRWMAHVAISESTTLSYTVTLNEDGTAEYCWGYYGSELLERMEGIWYPADSQYTDNEYILELVPTGGIRHEDGVWPYNYYGVYQIVCSDDGSVMKATWVNGSPLFHFYSGIYLELYKYESDADYYSIPILPCGSLPSV